MFRVINRTASLIVGAATVAALFVFPVISPSILLSPAQASAVPPLKTTHEFPALHVAAPARPRVATAVHAVKAVLASRTARSSSGTVTVRPGDILSAIAQQHCGNPADYTGLAKASGITDPDVITPGEKVTLDCTTATLASSVKPAAAGKVWGKTYGYPNYWGDGDGDGYDLSSPAGTTAPSQPQSGDVEHTASVTSSDQSAPAPAAASVSYSGSGGFQSCVISRESGGNSQVMNASGHYGLYQFAYGTWVSGGGAPGDFGHASVAEQNRVFASVYAAQGSAPWSPSDGC